MGVLSVRPLLEQPRATAKRQEIRMLRTAPD
jgi:hypothetical protein